MNNTQTIGLISFDRFDRHITIATGRAFAGSSQWGYRACVDPDGTVRVYDDVAGYYTTCHSLTNAQQRYIRARATTDTRTA